MYLKIFIGILSLQAIGSLSSAFANLQKNDIHGIKGKIVDIERKSKNIATYN